MKVSLVLYVLACAFSAMASSIRRKHSNDADNNAENFHPHEGIPHIAKYEYNKYYDEETNEESYQGKAMTCVPRDKLEALLNQYISTFSGIEDGGRMAKKTFDEDLKIYSQTRWWITTAVGGDLEKNIEKWAKACCLFSQALCPVRGHILILPHRPIVSLQSLKIAPSLLRHSSARIILTNGRRDWSPTVAIPSPSTGRATSQSPSTRP